MTILQVANNHFVAGGSDAYFMQIIDALQSSGSTVIPFCGAHERSAPTEWSRYFPRSIDSTRPRVTDVPRFIYSMEAKRNLDALLEDTKPDIAHLHIYYGRLTAAILPVLRKHGIPTVQTLHDFKLVCPVYSCLRDNRICEDCNGRQFWRATVHRCNRGQFLRSLASSVESYVSKGLGSHDSIDHYISVSNFQRERMLATGAISSEKISTIHNFVDTSKYSANYQPGKYVCYFGRVEELKGIRTLIEAMQLIPHVNLKIVGDGELMPTCASILQARNIRNVELCGFQSGDALRELVSNAICTVIATEAYENCPMVVLESLAYGKPVVGTNIGGIPELIDDGTDGFIVPIKDPAALAQRLEELAIDLDAAVEMGRTGRQKVEEKFGVDGHLSKVRAVYSEVTARVGR